MAETNDAQDNQVGRSGSSSTKQTVYYGDCRTILPLMEPNSVHLCLTDPPYKVTNWDTGFGTTGMFYGETTNSGHVQAVEPPEFREWLWEVKRVLVGNGQLVIFENPSNLHELYDALDKFGFIVKQTGIWHVTNRMNFIKAPIYRNHMDVWVWAVKGKPYTFHYDRGKEPMADVYSSPYVRNTDKRVPGAKPLDLIERFILVHTEPGETVLDPFLGTGTTMLACRRTGRSGIGIELRRELKESIEARIRTKHIGLEAY